MSAVSAAASSSAAAAAASRGELRPLLAASEAETEADSAILDDDVDGLDGVDDDVASPDAVDSARAVAGGVPLSWRGAACVVKCIVGAGSFYLPYGVRNAGLLGGFLGLIAFGLLCGFLSVRMMRAKRLLFPLEPVQLDDVAGHLFGRIARVLTTMSMVIAGIGGCAVYIESMTELLAHVFSDIQPCVLWWKLGIVALEIAIACLPTFNLVAMTAVLGDVCLVVALVGTVAGGSVLAGGAPALWGAFAEYTATFFTTDGGPALFAINAQTLPAFFAPVVFLFAVPSLLFPIENSLAIPKQWSKSSNVAFTIVTVINCLFATVACVIFGAGTKSFVVASLPVGVWWVSVIRVALLLDLAFTYNLTLIPSREVVEELLLGSTQAQQAAAAAARARIAAAAAAAGGTAAAGGSKSTDDESTMTPSTAAATAAVAAMTTGSLPYWRRVVVRVGINVLCCALAVLIPNISDLIAVGTSMVLSFMTFILAPAICMRTRWLRLQTKAPQFLDTHVRTNDDAGGGPKGGGVFGGGFGRSNTDAVKSAAIYSGYSLIMILGLAAGVATTYFAAADVVTDYRHASVSICSLSNT